MHLNMKTKDMLHFFVVHSNDVHCCTAEWVCSGGVVEVLFKVNGSASDHYVHFLVLHVFYCMLQQHPFVYNQVLLIFKHIKMNITGVLW